MSPDLPVFRIDRFGHFPVDERVTIHHGLRVGINPEDLAFISWPAHYEDVISQTAGALPHERVIHIVQNVRHGNPKWVGGYAARLLARPLSRIMITDEVDQACRPYLNSESLTETVLEGHAWEYFSKKRTRVFSSPIRVGYTTWKSRVGLRTEIELENDERFEFRSIRSTVAWDELRELYHWCDIFLSTPGPEQGFYLPGLEAMAAGSLVITSDAGGNRAYCRFGDNCLLVPMEDQHAYSEALKTMASWSDQMIETMRNAAYDILPRHTLAAERDGFRAFLDEVQTRTRG